MRLVVFLFFISSTSLSAQNWVKGSRTKAWSSVEYLDLSNARFGKSGIPDSLWTMTQLKGLKLRKNKLTSLSPRIGALTQLQYLDLSQNKLTALPESLGNLIHLDTLRLNRNELYALPNTANQWKALIYLDLWSNHIDDLPVGFENLPNLKVIDFSGITVYPEKQDELNRRFPNVELIFNKSCNCH